MITGTTIGNEDVEEVKIAAPQKTITKGKRTAAAANKAAA